MLRVLKTERGFTLMESLIAMAALTLLAVAGYNMFADVGKSMANDSLGSGVNTARTMIIDAVNSSLAWSNTLAENPSLACVKNRTSCGTLVGTPVNVKVIDASGSLILADTDDGAVGFDAQGRPCHTFPSLPCPIRFEVTWTPVCNPASCTNPQEKVSGRLIVKSSADASADKLKNLVQVSNYSFTLFRGAGFGGFADMCKSLLGVWDNNAKTCRLPVKGPCPDGQVVVGIDGNSNTKICRQLWFGQTSSPSGYGMCAAGQVMKGISSTGDPICYPIDMSSCHSTCYTNPDLCAIWTPDTGITGGDGGGGGDGGCGGADGADGGCGS